VSGIVVRVTMSAPADFSAVLEGSWTTATAKDLARRPVRIAGRGEQPLGELAEVSGTADGTIRFTGDLRQVNHLGAGLSEGAVVVEGNIGDYVASGMSGGSVEIRGDAGARAGAAAPEARRGMSGGELVVYGSVGEGAGALMRRGLLVVGGRVGHHAGAGMIAGTLVAFGEVDATAGLWVKRGSIVALAGITIPSTYRYACTYQPAHLRLTLLRLRTRYRLPVTPLHLNGFYRRYSGDLADLGKGEILAWKAS
jgi:formylmethanofuran dehydrogenase subunit C